jgi:hypothetical protein
LVLILHTDTKAKSIRLTNKPFNEKFGTTNWGINFSESKTRQIDTSALVNILKALPEEKEYNGCKYYQTRILKPEISEQELAAGITKQIHEQFPVFKRIFEPKQSERKETDADVQAMMELCV